MKKWTALVLALCLTFSLAACSKDPDNSQSDSSSSASVGNSDSEARSSGNFTRGELGDTLTNVFFSYRVEDAYLANEYEGKTPSEGNDFLIATIKVKNVSEDDLPMFSSDFQIQWGDDDNDEAFGYPIDQFTDEQMEDEYTLPVGESITKVVVYEVPHGAVAEGDADYSISYLEVYGDDFEGDMYFVYFPASFKA